MAGTLTPEARAAKRRLGRHECISCDAADVKVTTLNGNDAVVNTLVGNYREFAKITAGSSTRRSFMVKTA